MDIRFKCSNPICDVEFEKTEEEMKLNPEGLRFCWKCGKKLSIVNTEEIVETDIQTQVKNNLDSWIKEMGLEGAWELIERNSYSPMARLYFEEFRKRGIDLHKEK